MFSHRMESNPCNFLQILRIHEENERAKQKNHLHSLLKFSNTAPKSIINWNIIAYHCHASNLLWWASWQSASGQVWSFCGGLGGPSISPRGWSCSPSVPDPTATEEVPRNPSMRSTRSLAAGWWCASWLQPSPWFTCPGRPSQPRHCGKFPRMTQERPWSRCCTAFWHSLGQHLTESSYQQLVAGGWSQINKSSP